MKVCMSRADQRQFTFTLRRHLQGINKRHKYRSPWSSSNNPAPQPKIRTQRVLRIVEGERFANQLLPRLPQGIQQVRLRLHEEI